MDQKGSGNTSTTSTHPSPDLVECHYVASAIPWYELCSLTSIYPLILTTGVSFVSNMVAKYYLYDNYFDLPGALLCGRVVDMLHKVIFDSYIFMLCILILMRWYLNAILCFVISVEMRWILTFGKTWLLPLTTITTHLHSKVPYLFTCVGTSLLIALLVIFLFFIFCPNVCILFCFGQ